jgi:hypothetical protein
MRPRVADEGDGLHIWRVATNILIKQSRENDMGLFSSLGLGGKLTTHHSENSACYEMLNRWENLK